MRIGILEDDPALADQLQKLLSTAGHSSFVFHSGQKLIGFLSRETVDILLLDWNVPDVSGLDVIRWSRQHVTRHPPIVVLTSRTAEEDIVAALKAGADDYVIKPVQPAVLLARIEALCRRVYPEPPSTGPEKFGEYAFDTRTETATVRDSPIQLTAKEFALALMLFRNLNRTLSRSYIFEALWGSNPDLQTRTLDAHISKVRTKLGLRASNGFRLVPVYAYGYRLEAIGEGTA
ncbi:response regulator transcription factor [Sphingosinicella sp. CPCC 101087]|uniref:response regulator transcription factor n=1 Tax=Sphingosinicella sp. CPCC 101087 TaxID=2497754 RepID=UPI00101BB1D5|nr:response regulator transcription factor [Sphingosinicella sp. CPCC 101087]